MENAPLRPDASEHSPESSHASGSERGVAGWRLSLLLLLVLGGILLFPRFANREGDRPQSRLGQMSTSPTEGDGDSISPSPRPEGETVQLTIDFGNGTSRQFDALPWREGMTIADLMEEARKFRPGIELTLRGSGKMAFLLSLDRISGPGAGSADNPAGDSADSSRPHPIRPHPIQGWQFKINGELGQLGIGSQILAPGDQVFWIFGPG
jgi:hypothetical protein